MKHWYTWISKHYKYNWWNIDIHETFDIHEYQTLQV